MAQQLRDKAVITARLYHAASSDRRERGRPPGWAPWLAVTRFGMQLQPQRADDFQDGVEAWATLAGKRLE